VWDFLPYSYYEKGKEYKTEYIYRLKYLKESIKHIGDGSIRLIKSKVVNCYTDCMEYFQQVLNIGEEGLILKLPTNTWKDGKSQQVKMKLLFTVDLKLTGYINGNGKFENTLGSIIAESGDGVIKISASGFSDDLRDEIWSNKDKYMGKIVEIQCNAISRDFEQNWSLQHPVFKGFHVDKNEADSLQDIINNQNMILGLNK
jgi:DNA ligase-1